MAFVASFLVGLIAIAALLPASRRFGWLDHPDAGRKDHFEPTPVVGGIAILLAAVATIALLAALGLVDLGGDSRALSALGFASLLMLAVGLYDDLHDLNWRWRIGAQLIAALLLVFVGGMSVNAIGTLFGHPVHSLGWLSVPFTVFLVLALINALNMSDGVDGLTGGVVLAGVLMFAAAAFYSGDPALGVILLAVAGAVAAFVVFNMRRPGLARAKLFLGNGGSALLGLVIAWASLRLSQNPEHPVTAVLLPWLLVPPVVDAVALVIRRVVTGHSPFAADRNHLHHLMLDAGLTPAAIAVVLAATTLVLGGGAALALRYDWLGHGALVVIYVMMTVAWFGVTLKRERAVAMFRWLRGAHTPRIAADPPFVRGAHRRGRPPAG